MASELSLAEVNWVFAVDGGGGPDGGERQEDRDEADGQGAGFMEGLVGEVV